MDVHDSSPNSTKDDIPRREQFLDRYGPTVVRVTSIALGAAGIYMFCKSVRLFTQFKTATEIPEHFYQRHVRLRGVVNAVDGDGRLLVYHLPALRFPWQKPQPSCMCVQLAGVEMVDNGANWLRHNLPSNIVKFELLKQRDGTIVSDVFARRSRWIPLFYNVNRELVRRGLSRVLGVEDKEHLHDMQSLPRYSRLVQRLLISEHYADKRGIGYWKRPTMVEALASYPAQTVDIIKHSGLAVSLKLFYRQMKVAYSFLATIGRRSIPVVSRVLRITYTLSKNTISFIRHLLRPKQKS
uniref:TNase-like domain-containing protein n=1 Tax=Trichuris muris TaxID=70415 RepID=A0A5S6Q7M0_TRIMR